LEIAFESKFLRTICQNEADGNDRLGDAPATMLRHRLADLRAAASITDLIAGQPSVSEDGERLMVNFFEGHQIVAVANHVKNPRHRGKLDWDKVSRIRIVRVGDYE